jgi:hypothetical protein
MSAVLQSLASPARRRIATLRAGSFATMAPQIKADRAAVLQKPRFSRKRIDVDFRPLDLEGDHALDIASDQPPPVPTVVNVDRDDLGPDPPFDPRALQVVIFILVGFWLALGTAIAVLWL